MRLLGIDYGSKRVGVALSDEAGQFAIPYSVIANSRTISNGSLHSSGLIDEIENIASKNQVKEIVMGESRDYKGAANAIMVDGLKLKEQLESKGFIVHLEPEFMTSVQAERLQGKNAKSDSSAAALILQAYLDKEKKN
jgi:putative Holliday junction resolvase